MLPIDTTLVGMKTDNSDVEAKAYAPDKDGDYELMCKYQLKIVMITDCSYAS